VFIWHRERNRLIASVQDAVDRGEFIAAASICGKHWKQVSSSEPISSELLLAIIKGLHRQQQWEASVPFMQQLITQSNLPLISVRLKLAEILLRISQRPQRALHVLQAISAPRTPAQEAQIQKLATLAHHSLAQGDGELELSDD
jgi:hypothetical protein